MTRDDLDKLSPRELDAVVAERVMGWKRHHINSMFYVDAKDEKAFMARPAVVASKFHPSTTGDGMLAVIERIKDKARDEHCREDSKTLTPESAKVWRVFVLELGVHVGGMWEFCPREVCISAVLAILACEGVDDA